MKELAVIFDFNGTLFWDSEINYKSWYNFIKKNIKREYSREEYAILNGRTTIETLEKVYAIKLDNALINKLSNEKEEEYLKILEAEKNNISLAEGVESLIEDLLNNDIKVAIATSANPFLMEKYESIFKLSRFFKKEYIIANDGTLKSKPHPAIYNKAIEALKIKASNCIVFEDTKSGIISASRAKVGQIIAVNSIGSDSKTINNLKETSFFINNFNQVNVKKLIHNI